MNTREALLKAQAKLVTANVSNPRLDSEILLADSLTHTREWLIAHDDYALTTAQQKSYDRHIARRADREPVCYITNKLEFYGIELYIDNRVLSPRIETELIVEQAIKNAPRDSTLIDIGTGSGAIAIAIAKHRPDLSIVATEISNGALDVAILNANSILGPNHGISFVISDIWAGIPKRYDTVVTNLPYVSRDYLPQMKPEVTKEPALALYGGNGDGLQLYRRFYQGLTSHLASSALVYHESDPWQHQELIELAKVAGLKLVFEKYLILGFSSRC